MAEELAGDRVVNLKASDFILIALIVAVLFFLSKRAFHKAPSQSVAEQTRKVS